jgi:hypothetical protein
MMSASKKARLRRCSRIAEKKLLVANRIPVPAVKKDRFETVYDTLLFIKHINSIWPKFGDKTDN